MQFKKGDKVEWDSTSNGSTTSKQGEVVAVVPPKGNPPTGRFTGHVLRTDGGGLPRDHESYLVSVPGPGPKAKPRMYWPRVSALKPVEA